MTNHLTGEVRQQINKGAVFEPDNGSQEWTPALMVGGVAVHAYVDKAGVFRVSVHTDTGAVRPVLIADEGTENEHVPMEITVNGAVVFLA
jgi:hypothetical protein